MPKHLSMLRNIREAATKAAGERYGVERGDLRIYVHYQPSFCERTFTFQALAA